VIGSSTAAGYGAQYRPWVAILRDTYSSASVTVANLALAGTTTYSGLPFGTPIPSGRPAPQAGSNVDAALSYQPKALVVSYPTNDTAYGYGVDETVSNLIAIRNHATARGVPVIVVSTQPRNLSYAQLSQLQQIDDRVSGLVSPCFVAVRTALAGPDGRLAPAYDSGDGVHPNDAGHAVIAARVVSLIDSRRCVGTSR
jgi:lysophospholipase L1-like esterase